MKVTTKAYGLIDVDESQKITFPQGLLGFESLKEYVLLDAEREPFYWLQSIENEQVAFILINPFVFRQDYEVDIDNDILSTIGINEPKSALLFYIVTIPQDGTPMTANLQGPIVINYETKSGLQAVLLDPRWKTRHDIMAEIAKAQASADAKAAGQRK